MLVMHACVRETVCPSPSISLILSESGDATPCGPLGCADWFSHIKPTFILIFYWTVPHLSSCGCLSSIGFPINELIVMVGRPFSSKQDASARLYNLF